ncbi:hypothetical protein BGZ65_011609 [Modicella reniformis]|uniref:Tyr recombinase domain-containing protein n=1 Tax=Modicella reniformis TaxID=1440133 RepID=A0A9P6J3X0_9FUNG|nr:hypothetical protein BGZ65_011609 [Modicella reniformis]
MSYKDLSVIMEHLQKPEIIKRNGESLCLFFQAFAATGFCLWTRNDELVRLKREDLELDLRTVTGRPYVTITLTFRKTNKADPTKVNIYEIHPMPHEPHAYCYTKLNAWLKHLERIGRPLLPQDLVFPALDKKGRAKIMEGFAPTRIQSLLDHFTQATALIEGRNGRYTTHCFRRGGAQHRFMFATEKWSLKAVKWWGGWSEDEGAGTIMRYLLDEFVRYESGFGDVLNPERSDSQHSVFMGNADTEPVTQRTINNLQISLQNKARELHQETRRDLTDLGSTVSRIVEMLEQQKQLQQLNSSGPVQSVLESTQQRILQPAHVQSPTLTTVESQEDNSPITPRIPTVKSWKDVVKQWNDGDLSRNLETPLKDWDAIVRKTAPTLYSQRKTIAKEYEYWGRDETRMINCNGGAMNIIGDLLGSIREKVRERKAQIPGLRSRSTTRKGRRSKYEEPEDDEEAEEEEEEEEEGDEEVEEEEGEEEEKEPLTRKRKNRF